MFFRFVAVLGALVTILWVGFAFAKPSTELCEKFFTPAVPGEKVLACKYVGGDRPTREMNGQQYLTDVGTCWDFDLMPSRTAGAGCS